MFRRSRNEDEIAMIDASRYLAEMKREGLTAIVPAPEEKEARIDLITVLGGRRPNLYRLMLANVEQDGWVAMANKKNPPLADLNIVSAIRAHAPSLDGFRSKQVVEIAKTEAPDTGKSIMDYLRQGRRK